MAVEIDYCQVATALKDDMRLISVVLGTDSENDRAKESQKLLNYGFRFFKTQKLYTANTSLKKVRVWKGMVEELPLGIKDDLYITTPTKQMKSVQAQIIINKKIIAPISQGQSYGTLSIVLEDEIIAERELIALSNIAEGSFMQRIIDEIKLMLE